MSIERVNQVWSTDITYIRLKGGFVYLVAILDWFSSIEFLLSSGSTGRFGICTRLANGPPVNALVVLSLLDILHL
jgi:putative transposase